MGLDWHPAHKPRTGVERKFEGLFHELTCSERPRGFVSRLRSRLRRATPAEDRARLEELGVDPYSTLEVPRIGFTPAADAWARELYRQVHEPEESEEQFLARLHGNYALGLLSKCDGVPFYSREGRTDFRAEFLTFCEAAIGADLLERCFHSCLAQELASLAYALRACAAQLAAPSGIAALDGQWASEAEPESVEGQVHILYSAARWAEFWSSRGHGMVADW